MTGISGIVRADDFCGDEVFYVFDGRNSGSGIVAECVFVFPGSCTINFVIL